MPHGPIQQVAGVRQKSDTEGVSVPGAFTTFDDGTATFCGNGVTTCAQATGHYIDWLAKNEAAFRPFAGNEPAASLGAQLFLQQNRRLEGVSADKPVPNGELFHMDGTRLKDLLAPFAKNVDELRKVVENAAGHAGAPEGGGAMAKATGNVASRGLRLPID